LSGLLDFLVFELGDSLVVSVESLFGDFSVFVSDFSVFFVVLLGESVVAASVLLFFALLLVELSAAGLFVVVDDFVEGEALFSVTGLGLAVEVAAGVVVAATEAVAAGVMVAPTLAVAAGVALAFVEPVTLVVVPGAVVVVVPLVVALTPNVVGTVTP
jgi:hypothetical protein